MKILLDSCVAKGARDDLSALGHSVVHVSDLLRQAIVTVESDRIRVRLPEPDPDGEVPPPRAQ